MNLSKYAFALLLQCCAVAAHAVYQPPVVMTETPYYHENGSLDKTEYSIFNNLPLGTDIVAFGVTTSIPNIQAWTTNPGWIGWNISKRDWNAGLTLERYCDSGDGMRFVCDAFETGVGASSLEYGDARMGRFESLFGTNDEYVNFYWLDQQEVDGENIWAGESMRNFSSTPRRPRSMPYSTNMENCSTRAPGFRNRGQRHCSHSGWLASW